MDAFIPLALGAGVVLVVGILICLLLGRVRRFSRQVFGADSLAEGLKWQEEMLAETPKSVSGMTRIYEPLIQEDFPEFNWQEFRRKAEQLLLLAFDAVSAGDGARIRGGFAQFRQQVENQIADNARAGIREVYEQVRIHNTEIARYEKKDGTCVITLQSAVGHIHYKERAGKVIWGGRKLPVQTKYNIELMYVQDAARAGAGDAVGVNCPNCGAPITKLGVKFCEYCGTEVIPVNIQVWSISGYYQVDYQSI